MGKKFIIQQTSAGEPVGIGNLTLYPVARSYRIDVPAARGGLIWNHPTAVIVEGPDGTRQALPIVDQTRRLQIVILIAGLVGTLLTWIIYRKPRNPAKKEQ
jgi:hypothetical protein